MYCSEKFFSPDSATDPHALLVTMSLRHFLLGQLLINYCRVNFTKRKNYNTVSHASIFLGYEAGSNPRRPKDGDADPKSHRQ